jgi:hypothetical protein
VSKLDLDVGYHFVTEFPIVFQHTSETITRK